MTRAASGAQRSGAAALTLSRSRDDLTLVREYCGSSFFVPRTPARWGLQILRAGWHGAAPPGSPVLHGSGGGTGNRLKSAGSTVLFSSPSRDARTAVQARAYGELVQNHRTLEPGLIVEGYQGLAGSVAVLGRFWRSNIIRVGYSGLSFAALTGPDLGLGGGGVGRKFRGSARSIGQRAGAVGNGGFPPFRAGGSGRVGMAVSEWRGLSVSDHGFAAGLRKPARLTEGRGGLDLAPRGGTPPMARAAFPSSLAQPVNRVSFDLLDRRPLRGAGEGALISSAKMGSGERDRARAQTDRRLRAIGYKDRVGVMGASSASGVSRKLTTLWAGGDHVN